MNSRSQTIGSAVSDSDRIFLGLELGNGADGAEDLLLHDLHVLADAGEDGGLDEVTLFAVSFPSDLNLGAGLLTFVDVSEEESQPTAHAKEH